MLKIYAKDPNCKPERQHITDAGMDLKSAEYKVLKHGKTELIKCGIHIEIPTGFVGLIFSRSGLATKHGIALANAVGVIDSDYRGEIMCALKLNATGCRPEYTINKYDRIAQLVIVPCSIDMHIFVEELKDLKDTDRGTGGFGHTGVN